MKKRSCRESRARFTIAPHAGKTNHMIKPAVVELEAETKDTENGTVLLVHCVPVFVLSIWAASQ